MPPPQFRTQLPAIQSSPLPQATPQLPQLAKSESRSAQAPLQFIKAMRLNNAVLLLRQGASVGEAAYAVGYASTSQFSREFRRRFDLPPKAWARAHEEQGRSAAVGSPHP